MKQLILNSIIGDIALTARNKISLLSAALLQLESVGTLANDEMATLLITRMCQPGKTFIDVGAHIGSITSDVLRHDKSIKIVAIEAIPEKAANLRKKFPDVEIVECAVGESDIEVPFFINTAQSGYSSLGRPKNSDNTIQEIRVPMKKLDDLVNSKGVDAIKIDVEGAELGVILSASTILAESRPTIMFESASDNDDNLGYTKEALWRQMSEHDYTILIPNRVAHNGEGLSLEGFLESHIYPRRTTNYFAVANERRTEIRDRARSIVGVKL